MSGFDIFPAEDTTPKIKPIYGRRTLTKVEPPLREFVRPSSESAFIHWLFRYRCIDCKRAGQEINEIVPRSRSKNAVSDWENRVLLCSECHRKYHADGVTDDKMERMKLLRITFLKSFDRSEYVNWKLSPNE